MSTNYVYVVCDYIYFVFDIVLGFCSCESVLISLPLESVAYSLACVTK